MLRGLVLQRHVFDGEQRFDALPRLNIDARSQLASRPLRVCHLCSSLSRRFAGHSIVIVVSPWNARRNGKPFGARHPLQKSKKTTHQATRQGRSACSDFFDSFCAMHGRCRRSPRRKPPRRSEHATPREPVRHRLHAIHGDGRSEADREARQNGRPRRHKGRMGLVPLLRRDERCADLGLGRFRLPRHPGHRDDLFEDERLADRGQGCDRASTSRR